jgi:hypothetical protein
VAGHVHEWVTYIYLAWAAFAFLKFAFRPRTATAFLLFAKIWRTHVRPSAA